MCKSVALFVGTLLCSMLSIQSTLADDGAALIGVWKLVAFDLEFRDGRPAQALYGKNPTGFLIFTPQGRMSAIIEGKDRKSATTDAETADLLRTMIAYSGTYRVQGDQWTTKVDAAWQPAWRGTDQVRQYKLNGDRLQVIAMWQPNQNLAGKPITRGVLEWERVK